MNKNRILKYILFLFIIILFSQSTVFATGYKIINDDTVKAVGEFKNEINFIANILLAIAAVSSVLIFILHFLKLGITFNHPMWRYRAIKDIWVSGICTALIGAIGLIFKLYVGIYM